MRRFSHTLEQVGLHKPSENDDITFSLDGNVGIIKINRPDKMNSFAIRTFAQLESIFEHIENSGQDIRSVVLTANGKHFTAGLDLKDIESDTITKRGPNNSENYDPARSGYDIQKKILILQKQLCAPERARVPVICAIHGLCIGAGVDLASACDIRLCSKDTKFSIKEVDVGICADLGSLQRVQKVVGNDSFFREVAYTGRFFSGEEALDQGFVSYMTESQDQCIEKAFQIAQNIAEKSPVAIAAIKQNVLYSRDHTIEEGVQHAALLNMTMLQTNDVKIAIEAMQLKLKAKFAELSIK